jgi:hypothetical protein
MTIRRTATRQLNNFQRTEVALKSKSILEEIVKQNESQGGKGVRIRKGKYLNYNRQKLKKDIRLCSRKQSMYSNFRDA